MAYVGTIRTQEGIEYPIGSMLYGTCSTAANTEIKTVVMPNFTILKEGITIHVLFKNKNTHTSPKLKVGSTAAKTISTFDTAIVNISWEAGSLLTFTYSQDMWVINNAVNIDTNLDSNSSVDVPSVKAVKDGLDSLQTTIEEDLESKNPNINGTKATSTTSIYAPTTAGSKGQLLVGNGSAATPTWLPVGKTGELFIGQTGTLPKWLGAPAKGQVLRAAAANTVEWTNNFGIIFIGKNDPGLDSGAFIWVDTSL